jgi:hypothetical protein
MRQSTRPARACSIPPTSVETALTAMFVPAAEAAFPEATSTAGRRRLPSTRPIAEPRRAAAKQPAAATARSSASTPAASTARGGAGGAKYGFGARRSPFRHVRRQTRHTCRDSVRSGALAPPTGGRAPGRGRLACAGPVCGPVTARWIPRHGIGTNATRGPV